MSIPFDKIPTPCFLLNEEALEMNLQILRLIQDEADVKIICALKGFAFWHSFPLLKQYLSGATASSLNEARLINEEMNCEAHTYCPVYKDNEFETLLQLSSHLTFNSLSQYEHFLPIYKAYGKKVSLGLRVNPEYSEIETDLYNPAIEGSRLGIRRKNLGEHLPEGIEGIHFHVLCENSSETLERTLQVFEDKFSSLIKEARWLNLGGGHLITKENYNVELLVQIIKGLHQRYPNLEEIILEPGEAIGWQTGVLLAKIQDIIKCEHFDIAMLDTSFACHMPDCLEMPYKPIIIGAHEPTKDDKYIYRMGGNSCLAGDFMGMGDYAFTAPLHIGQTIIFDDMIHYTMVKTTFFNGIQHPHIAVWTRNQELLMLRQFGYEDYKNKLS